MKRWFIFLYFFCYPILIYSISEIALHGKNATTFNNTGSIINLADINLTIDMDNPEFVLRSIVITESTIDSFLEPEGLAIVPRFFCGLNYKEIESRVIIGAIQERGINTRLRSLWSKTLPFPEDYHFPSANLSTRISQTNPIQMYYAIKIPVTTKTKWYGSVFYQIPGTITITVTNQLHIHDIYTLQIEGAFHTGVFSRKEEDAWFVETPLLPECQLSLYAISVLFQHPRFAIASTTSMSQAFPQKDGYYSTLSFKYNIDRWTIYLAGDGTYGFYTGTDNHIVEQKLRSRMMIQYHTKQKSVYSAEYTIRTADWLSCPEQSSLSLQIWNKNADRDNNWLPAGVNLCCKQIVDNPLKIQDDCTASIKYTILPWTFTLEGTTHFMQPISEEFIPIPFAPFDWDALSFSGWELMISETISLKKILAGVSCIYQSDDSDFNYGCLLQFKEKHWNCNIKTNWYSSSGNFKAELRFQWSF